jgi:hypothetical protein
MFAATDDYGNEDVFIIYSPGLPAFGYGPCPDSAEDFCWNMDPDSAESNS